MAITMTREDLPLRRLASGALQSVPIFRFTGEQPGKKVYIQANIHGPEIAGIGAAYDLIGLLREEKNLHGSITVIPSINPVGLDTKVGGYQVGYADPNESVVGNFNRIYQMLVDDKAPEQVDPDEPQRVVIEHFVQTHLDADLPTIMAAFQQALGATLAEMRSKREGMGLRFGLKLALTIQQLAYDADYVIDMHTAGKAIYHHFTFAECMASGRYFGIPYFIELEKSFSGVLDEAFVLPWLKLQRAFAAQGRQIAYTDFDKEAFTLEFGSADYLDATAMQQDAQRVVNYLRYKGVLDGTAQLPALDFFQCQQKDYVRYNAPTGGLVLWHKQEGERVEMGEIIATILQTYQEQVASRDSTTTPVIAQKPGLIINRAESQVVHEGMALCSIATQLKPVN